MHSSEKALTECYLPPRSYLWPFYYNPIFPPNITIILTQTPYINIIAYFNFILIELYYIHNFLPLNMIIVRLSMFSRVTAFIHIHCYITFHCMIRYNPFILVLMGIWAVSTSTITNMLLWTFFHIALGFHVYAFLLDTHSEAKVKG